MKSINVIAISSFPLLSKKDEEFLCKSLFITPTEKESYDLEKGIKNNYDPLKMLNIDVSKLPNFHAHFVTSLAHAVTSPFSNDEKQITKGEIMK